MILYLTSSWYKPYLTCQRKIYFSLFISRVSIQTILYFDIANSTVLLPKYSNIYWDFYALTKGFGFKRWGCSIGNRDHEYFFSWRALNAFNTLIYTSRLQLCPLRLFLHRRHFCPVITGQKTKHRMELKVQLCWHSTSKCEEITTFMSKLYFVKAIVSLLLMRGLSATYTRTEKVALVTLLSKFSNPLTRCKDHYFQINWQDIRITKFDCF